MLLSLLQRLRRRFEPAPVVYGAEGIANLIDTFMGHAPTLAPYAWDDFMSAPLAEPREQLAQSLAALVEIHYPARKKGEWCSEAGGDALRRLARALRSGSLPFPPTEAERAALEAGDIPERYRQLLAEDERPRPMAATPREPEQDSAPAPPPSTDPSTLHTLLTFPFAKQVLAFEEMHPSECQELYEGRWRSYAVSGGEGYVRWGLDSMEACSRKRMTTRWMTPSCGLPSTRASARKTSACTKSSKTCAGSAPACNSPRPRARKP